MQVAALIADSETREVKQSLNVIVQPMGWEIPQDVIDIHGITTERALREGVPERMVAEMLWPMWRRVGLRVGHNESFDARLRKLEHAQ